MQLSPRLTDPVPIDAIRASSRFFVSPSPTSSLIEEARISAELSSVKCEGMAVVTESADPCGDFRASMKEMVETRKVKRKKLDWGFMEELLFAYLSLNDESVHCYVVRAFKELVEEDLEFFWLAGLGDI